jgi:hypothetical protein
MKDSTVELMDRHAEALLAGGGEAAAHFVAADPEQTALFKTAARVKSALAPITSVAPRAEFVSKLKHQLIREANALQMQEVERKEGWVWIAVGLGGLVYAASVTAMSIKTALWVLSLVLLAMGWRKRPKLAPAKETVRP